MSACTVEIKLASYKQLIVNIFFFSQITMPDLTIFTSNVCCFDYDLQVPRIAACIQQCSPDIMCLQEANGCIPLVLEQLNKSNAAAAALYSFDRTTHILIRNGLFLPTPKQAWPFHFYSLVWFPYLSCRIIIVNVHLCEKEWRTSDWSTEWRYRGCYLARMIAQLNKYYPNHPVIFAGDFNSLHPQMPTDRFTDCATQSYDRNTWPVGRSHLLRHPYMLSESPYGAQPCRIDYIFASNECQIVQGTRTHYLKEDFYSDHKALTAVVAVPKLGYMTEAAADLGAIENWHSTPQLLQPQVQFIRKEVIRLSHLSGERNMYAHVFADGVDAGYFYLDGLETVEQLSLVAPTRIEQGVLFSTLNSDQTKQAQLLCVHVCNEAQEVLAKAANSKILLG